jgi:hypothetical protein
MEYRHRQGDRQAEDGEDDQQLEEGEAALSASW